MSVWTCFYFVNRFIHIIFLDSTYKWYHGIFVFLWLYLVWWSQSPSMMLQMTKCFSFLRLGNILRTHTHTHTHTHTYYILFIHSSVDGPLGCFHVLAVISSAAMNIVVHVSFWIRVLVSLRNHHTVLHSGRTSLHFHQWYRIVLFSPHPLQHILSVGLLMTSPLTGVSCQPGTSLSFWFASL